MKLRYVSQVQRAKARSLGVWVVPVQKARFNILLSTAATRGIRVRTAPDQRLSPGGSGGVGDVGGPKYVSL